ncbi:hypothetical protein LSG31_04290 [Fodinisporobacter ferrooxydans]|uniref:Transposase InsH N-terminal domain-containing protein n=1 Tax=Fodinisporobacter ferrooxydans TaxID=2901836 RepID=A0ABY4CM30_9BACL|nr:hypothetical protein LSG31_04290 [Alicyclobacillaceae bacterium MYW30-H2]
MTVAIIPKSYSNVIYLQSSFCFQEPSLPNYILERPFAKVALNFPWKTVFASCEQEFLEARYAFYKKEPEKEEAEGLFDLPVELDRPMKRISTKGRKGTNFYALLKAFLLAPLLYVEVMVESVYQQVVSNPAYATVCNFEKIPSLKTFERFDQIMTESGLWEKVRILTVQNNFDQGILESESTIAVDTSHIEAEATLHATRKCCDQPINL